MALQGEIKLSLTVDPLAWKQSNPQIYHRRGPCGLRATTTMEMENGGMLCSYRSV